MNFICIIHKCCNSCIRKPRFTTFSNESLLKWRNLYQWSDRVVECNLLPIKDEYIEVSVLEYEEFPRFLITLLNVHSTSEFPEMIGNRVTPTMHETSDPEELKILLQVSPNSHLIVTQLLKAYSMHPLYANANGSSELIL